MVAKIKINTEIWKEEDKEKKNQSILSAYTLALIFAMINIAYGLLTDNGMMAGINAMPLITAILAQISYNKHRKEEKSGK